MLTDCDQFFLCVIGPKRQLFLGSAKRISEFGFFRSTLLLACHREVSGMNAVMNLHRLD